MKPLLEEAFRIGVPLVMLAVVAWIYWRIWFEARVKRSATSARYLEDVGILAMIGVSSDPVTHNQHRRNIWCAKRAGMWPWRILPPGVK